MDMALPVETKSLLAGHSRNGLQRRPASQALEVGRVKDRRVCGDEFPNDFTLSGSLGELAQFFRPLERNYPSDTPPVLAPGCEELKCDVVGISKRQCRVVRRVHDATV